MFCQRHQREACWCGLEPPTTSPEPGTLKGENVSKLGTLSAWRWKGLQTLPSNLEGISNHFLQLPHFMDGETEGLRGDVVSPRHPAGSWQLCKSSPRSSLSHQMVKRIIAVVQLRPAPSEGRHLVWLFSERGPSHERQVGTGQ